MSVHRGECLLVMTKCSHLSKLKIMCQSATHFDKMSRSVCKHNTVIIIRLNRSVNYNIIGIIIVIIIMLELILFDRSLMNNKKSNGPI